MSVGDNENGFLRKLELDTIFLIFREIFMPLILICCGVGKPELILKANVYSFLEEIHKSQGAVIADER